MYQSLGNLKTIKLSTNLEQRKIGRSIGEIGRSGKMEGEELMIKGKYLGVQNHMYKHCSSIVPFLT